MKIENKIHRVTSSEMKKIEKELAKMDYLKICKIDASKTNSCKDLYKEIAKAFNFKYTDDYYYYLDYIRDLYDEMNLDKQGFAIIIYNYEKSKKYDTQHFEKIMSMLCEEYLEIYINCKREEVEVFFSVYLVD